MALLRYLELAEYAFLNFVPYMLLALYPVKDCLRWSKQATLCVAFFLFALETARTVLIAGGFASAAILSPINLAIQISFYVYVSNQFIGKSAFLLIFLSNLASSIGSLAKYTEGKLYPLMAVEQYRDTFSMCLFLLELVVLIPMFYYIKNVYAPVSKNSDDNNCWKYIWIVPAVFYIMWHVYVFHNHLPAMNILMSNRSTVMQLTIAIAAFISCHIVLCFIREQTHNLELIKKTDEQALRMSHYNNIQDRIEEARRVRHDVQHHMHVLYYLALEGNIEDIKNYIESYKKQYLTVGVISYCDNLTANILFRHYHIRAKDSNIEFTARAVLPQNLPFPKEDMSVLFGNLLENALNASEKESHAKVTVSAKYEKGFLFFDVRNSFTKKLPKNEDHLSQSGDDSNSFHGIGLHSVKHIVDSYKGKMHISLNDGIYSCSVLIPLEA